jgi:hypothetical protein
MMIMMMVATGGISMPKTPQGPKEKRAGRKVIAQHCGFGGIFGRFRLPFKPM